MPAPLAVDKEQVRMLFMEVGGEETARRTGIKPVTVRQWARRHGWSEGHKEKKSLVAGFPTPAKDALAATLPETMRPVAVTGVTKPVDALADLLSEDSRETRIGLSRAARSAADRARTMDGDEVIASARQLKEVAGIASTVHGWEKDGGGPARISIYGSQVAIVQPDSQD